MELRVTQFIPISLRIAFIGGATARLRNVLLDYLRASFAILELDVTFATFIGTGASRSNSSKVATLLSSFASAP